MSNIQIILSRDIYQDNVVEPVTLTNPLYVGDNLAQRVRFRVFRRHGDIAPVDMSSLAIRAYFARPDGGTVMMDGVSGKEWSYVDLPAACYAYPGTFDFVIKSVVDTAETTIMRVVGELDKPVTGTIVDPGTGVGNIEEIVEAFLEIDSARNTCVEAAGTSTAAAETATAAADAASADAQTASGAAASAQESAQAAGASAANASESETSASGSAAAAAASETNAASSATDAAGSAADAAASKAAAQAAQNAAQAAQTAAETAASEEVADWLAAHVNPETGYVLDNTLAIEGAAADAKAAGDKIGDLKSAIDIIDNSGLYTEWTDVNQVVPGSGTYDLSVGIGNTVSTTRSTGASWGSQILPVVAGDIFIVSGIGGAKPRLWGFTDSNYVLKTVANAITGQQTDVQITAPVDGYLFYNSQTGASVVRKILKRQIDYKIPELENDISDLGDSIDALDDKYDDILYDFVDTDKTKELVKGKTYVTNGDTGTTVDMTGGTGNQFSSLVDPCVAGDKYVVTGTGGNTPRLWCFVDEEYKIISKSAGNATLTNGEITAPAAGYLIFQCSTAYAYSITKLHVKTLKTDIEFDSVDETLYPFTSFAMFRSIGALGDSYTEGDIVNSAQHWTTVSGINYVAAIAKRNGISDYAAYGSGGSTTETYLERPAFAQCLADTPKDFYMIAFGLNDAAQPLTLGSISDIHDDYTQNPTTFYGCYGKILSQLIAHAPNAKIAIMGIWLSGNQYTPYTNAAKEIADHFGIMFMSPQDDPFFTSRFFTANLSGGHPTAMHYAGMGLAIERLFAKCVANNPDYFKYAIVG